MDFANERYVRVYTRDTPETLLWPYEVNHMWWAFLRKVDRAGVVDLGSYEPAIALAALLRAGTTPPVELVRQALAIWTADGGPVEMRVLPNGSRYLVVRNFLPAQEVAQSDAERKRASRALHRDRGRLESVTKPDASSASSPDPSQSVTPCRAVPCRAEPERASAPANEQPEQLSLKDSSPPKPKRKRAAKPKATEEPRSNLVAMGWKIWRELYRLAYGTEYADGEGCGRAMHSATTAAARAARETHPDGHPADAAGLDRRVEQLLRHRFAHFLADEGFKGFLNDQRHALRFLDRDVARYGLPWGPGARSAPELRPAPEPTMRPAVAAELAGLREAEMRGELSTVADTVEGAKKGLPGTRAAPKVAGA